MKKLITFTYLFSIAVSAIAQVDYIDYSKKELKHTTAADRVNASIYMGAGMAFSNSKSAPAAVATYIAPAISYQLSQKFKLNFSVIHYQVSGNSFINHSLADNRFANSNKLYSGNVLQLEGQYLVNAKTTVSGSLLYHVNPLSSSTQNNYKGASLGIDYKVTPHTTFSVRTTFIQGNGSNYNPYSTYPLGPNPMIPTGIRPAVFNTSPVNF